jgi:hypothetical protein
VQFSRIDACRGSKEILWDNYPPSIQKSIQKTKPSKNGGDLLQIPDRCKKCDEDAFTGLELVVVIAVLIGVAAFLLVYMSGGETPRGIRTFPEGTIAESVYQSGDHLQPVGSVFGFPAVSGKHGNAEVMFRNPDPGKLGAVRLTTSLFIGDTGAIDMDRVNVSWAVAGSYEDLQQTSSQPLVCPNWTISGKSNMLPGRTADSDNWLEPGEQFEIMSCPSTGVQPYGIFTLMISPDGSAIPIKITRTTPPDIHPVMNLK